MSNDKYPSPQSNPTFVRVWNMLIDAVITHEKFRPGDLLRLETLCELYVEKEKLKEILDLIGFTYDSADSKGAVAVKVRPEVQMLARVQANIILYSKSLGLVLREPKEVGPKDDEQEEWA